MRNCSNNASDFGDDCDDCDSFDVDDVDDDVDVDDDDDDDDEDDCCYEKTLNYAALDSNFDCNQDQVIGDTTNLYYDRSNW